jgi:hypothetical protein
MERRRTILLREMILKGRSRIGEVLITVINSASEWRATWRVWVYCSRMLVRAARSSPQATAASLVTWAGPSA